MKHRKLHTMNRLTLLGLLLILSLAFASVTVVSAQLPNCTSVCYVNINTGNNSNSGATPDDALANIRNGITRVSSGGEVIVAAGTYNETSNLFKNVTITGAGADVTIINVTGQGDEAFDMTVNGVIVVISGFTITGSDGDGLDATMGTLTLNDSVITGNTDDGIEVKATSNLTLNNSTVSNNQDAGIVNFNNVVLNNSTVSGNGTSGISSTITATVTLNHVTIANNRDGLRDGNITVNNSIIGANTAIDCFLTPPLALIPVGNNLHTDGTCAGIPQVSSSDLALQALADNGGSTPTHALGTGSDAIDAVTTCEFIGGGNVTADQRGISRPQGDACDIGAYEGEVLTGALEVTKVVNWGQIPVNPAQNFEICITGPLYPQGDCKDIGANGGDLLWDNLLPGEYSINETTPAGSWNVQEPSPVTVVIGETATATVINTNTAPTTGSINVTKIVDWGDFEPNQAVIFEICITGPSYPNPTVNNGGCQFTDFDGGVLPWDDLLPGAYTVDEVDPVANWSVQEHVTPVIVVAGETATATVINTYTPPQIGSITVTKNVDWNDFTPDGGQTFLLCINGEGTNNVPDCRPVGSNGGSVIFSDIPTGDYNVYELDPGEGWTASGGGNVSVTIGSNVPVTITNVHDAPVIVDPPTCDAETDLSGWYDLGTTSVTGTVRNNNSITCEYQIGMASYMMYDLVIDNQDIFDQTNMIVTLAPGQEVRLSVNLPECATQFDLFYGETLQDLNGVRYGDRLLAFLQHTDPGFCTRDADPT